MGKGAITKTQAFHLRIIIVKGRKGASVPASSVPHNTLRALVDRGYITQGHGILTYTTKGEEALREYDRKQKQG